MLNALTIDLEEWFCSHNLQAAVQPQDWDQLPWRAATPTLRLLEILERRGVRATFFVLGWLAERQPTLVQAVQAAGHEIASHGYAHRLTWQHSPDSFRDDLRRAQCAIEDATGVTPVLFRAPAFSITRRCLWAPDVLAEAGFVADSSVFPLSWHPEYGVPQASLVPFRHANGLIELPMSVVEAAGKRFPVSGGAYFRLLLYPAYRALVRHLHRQGRPLLFYLHPWELDDAMPTLRGLSAGARFRHYTNTHTVAHKLQRLVNEFAFAPLGRVYAHTLCEQPTDTSV